jgi:HPt (histidine-containing phosphotransfer) domain-containing protein
MIDKNIIRENLKYYDKSVVAEIIELFISEYPARFEALQKSIDKLDFAGIDNNAHSLKGIVAYLSPDIFELARKLEQLGKQGISESLQKVFDELKAATLELVKTLEEMSGEYRS